MSRQILTNKKNSASKKVLSRREALKALTAATGALSLAALPNRWQTPIVEVGTLPVHAQTSITAPEMDAIHPSGSIWISDVEAINTAIDNLYQVNISNTGTADLNLTGSPRVTLTGDTEFTLDTDANTPVAPGGSTFLRIRFVVFTATQQLYTTTVSIANNDTDENPYTGTIQVFVL